MKIPWLHDDSGHTASKDVQTLRAWENGVIPTSTAVHEIAKRNRFDENIFAGMSEKEIADEFGKLGYIRECEDE